MSSNPPARSSSVGALPREKRHFTSRVESTGTTSLDVRCGCQYFQCDSLLPDRINPIDSRPESKIGFIGTPPYDYNRGSNLGEQCGLLIEKHGVEIDQLSTKSFGLPIARHPDADRISAKSFGGQKSFEKQINKRFGSNQQILQRGLIIKSISDASETDLTTPSWQQRELSMERHSKSRELDTVSRRSVGLKRISRTPSKTDLFVADINIPSTSSNIMPRLETLPIPQFNIIAPTPAIENREQFSVYDEFHKNRPSHLNQDNSFDSQNKENYLGGFKPFVLQNQDLDLDYVANKAYSKNILEMHQENLEQNKLQQSEEDKQKINGNEKQQQIQEKFGEKIHLNIQKQQTQEHEQQQKETEKEEHNEERKEDVQTSNKDAQENLHRKEFSKEQIQNPLFQQNLLCPPELFVTQPELLKRHHLPEVENSAKESEIRQTEEENNLQPKKEMLRTPSFMKRLSLRPSDTIELVAQSTVQFIETPQKVIQQKSAPKAVASSVTETFSLKVDEMDQYLPKRCRTRKSNSLDRSRESYSPFIRSVTPISNDFFPNKTSQSQLFSKSQPGIFQSSQQNIGIDPNNFEYSKPRELCQELISIPIDISKPHLTPQISSENENYNDSSKFTEFENLPSSQPTQDMNSIKKQKSESGSQKTLEQRILHSNLLRRKQYFDRTQSQDRSTSYGGSNIDLESSRMMKTVSFDFAAEHKSRLSAFDSTAQLSPLSKEKREWLDRTYFMRDHEYEPIGRSSEERTTSQHFKEELTLADPVLIIQVPESMEVDHETNIVSSDQTEIKDPEIVDNENIPEYNQQVTEEPYFSSVTTTPNTESRTESRTDYIHTSQVDSSALEELPLKAESRKKGFVESAHDKSKKVQANIKSQAVKIRTKIRGIKKTPNSSPKKDRKRFKAPEFSKIKIPEVKFKTPDMSKLKTLEFKKIEFKRPEFTKFNKPDMSKFKMPEKFSSLKLRRSKSLKVESTAETPITTPESSIKSPKKMFDFNFGTYPRRKKDKKIPITKIVTTDDIHTNSETSPSFESAKIPRGTRDKGPVGSKWTDKFSEVSYGDNESGKYQRYESSEPESIEPRESSLERKIRENLDRVAKEDLEFGILQTEEQKQFAEFDEENRAIHEISKIRESEFKQRRPMIHQDSDLVSEEGKEIGWSEKDILRNKMLKQAEPTDHQDFTIEDALTGSITNTNIETQSTGSSGAHRQKGVIEEIDDDEFFLRKRGISQDNIEIRNYISSAIRQGFENPVNALAQIGNIDGFYQNDRNDYGYDIPPPKPRRAKNFNNFDLETKSAKISQEFDAEKKESYDDNISLPQIDTEYFKQIEPNRHLRKSKKQYSQDSQEVPDLDDIPYFDDEQMFFKRTGEVNNLGHGRKINTYEDSLEKLSVPPKAPKRRKKQTRESIDKESYLNEYDGRSISNSYVSDDDQQEELVVYRTEHEYVIPLAQPEQFTSTPSISRRSRSRSRITDDDRTSHGADSQIFNEDEIIKNNIKENGYAVVKKEPPPRPPPPTRKKRTSNIFDLYDQRFATLPITHIRKDSPIPQRPKRNYSTIGPSRPPRRRSTTSLGDTNKSKAIDTIQYEELDLEVENFDRIESGRNLKSGEIINKMKDRPLPAPPRPPREHKKFKSFHDDNEPEEEKIIIEFQQNGNYEIEKSIDKCIEVEVSTQTDPLPDDFICEEFEITDDMKIIEPRRPKTLEDILKEEQEAELERAKQLANEEDINFTRGLQRFREANQRSYSERSRSSTGEHSRTSLSRPTTPSAILIEKRIPTPLPYLDQTVLTASLTVQPIDDDEIVEKIESNIITEEKTIEKKDDDIITYNIDSENERIKEENLLRRLGLIKQENGEYKPVYMTEKDLAMESNLDHEPLEIKDTIASDDEKLEENVTQDEILSDLESPPQPPPRRRSSIGLAPDQTIKSTSDPTPTTQLMPIEELSATSIEAVIPNRLTVSDLEVERLSVNALHAAQITVSQLHGSQISADDLDCKSGNIIVRNLELPQGLIEEIVERVRSSERPFSQVQTQTTETDAAKPLTSTEEPPARPPPPSIPQPQIFPSEYFQYSIPPSTFYQLQPPNEGDTQPLQPHRRRRLHRRRDSSSEEESYREKHRNSRQGTRSPEPTVGELGGQILSACGTSVVRGMNQILNYLRVSEKDGTQRSSISTAIIIIIIATLGFILLGLSGKNIHHHHWDFFNLPNNDNRGNQ